jgi:hypothetical protein
VLVEVVVVVVGAAVVVVVVVLVDVLVVDVVLVVVLVEEVVVVVVGATVVVVVVVVGAQGVQFTSVVQLVRQLYTPIPGLPVIDVPALLHIDIIVLAGIGCIISVPAQFV